MRHRAREGSGPGGETAAPHFPFQPQDFPGERPATLVTSHQVRGRPTHSLLAQRGNRGGVGTAVSPWRSPRPECQASMPAACCVTSASLRAALGLGFAPAKWT